MSQATFAALAFLLAPSSAAAGVTVRAEVEVGGAPRLLVVKSFGGGDESDSSSGTTFFDGSGNRCELLLNAEPVGSQTFMAIKVRCVDARGRVLRRTEPNLLVKNGEVATINIGGDGEGVSVRALATGDPAVDSPVALRRDFFAEAGLGTYALYTLRHPWESLACEEGDFPIDFREGSISLRLEGRYRAGDVLQTVCTAQTAEGSLSVPIILSFF